MVELERELASLRNIYWHIRNARGRRLRQLYRRAQKEKARLAGLGFDQELIRLYCLYLANPAREVRYNRCCQRFESLRQLVFDFT